MAVCTTTFGSTMFMDNLDGEAVTPPFCATSAPIEAAKPKATEEELEASSVSLYKTDRGTYGPTTLSIDRRGDQCT